MIKREMIAFFRKTGNQFCSEILFLPIIKLRMTTAAKAAPVVKITA
jgi:hypothetical protein